MAGCFLEVGWMGVGAETQMELTPVLGARPWRGKRTTCRQSLMVGWAGGCRECIVSPCWSKAC